MERIEFRNNDTRDGARRENELLFTSTCAFAT